MILANTTNDTSLTDVIPISVHATINAGHFYDFFVAKISAKLFCLKLFHERRRDVSGNVVVTSASFIFLCLLRRR